MKSIRNRSILIIIFALITFPSCKDMFQRINTPPTSVTKIKPGLVFTYVQRQMMWIGGSNDYWKTNTMTYGAWIQHWGVWDHNFQPPHYIPTQDWMDTDWQNSYGCLHQLYNIQKVLIESAGGKREDPSIRSKLAEVKILSILIAEETSAIVGDIPYFDADQGIAGIVKPSFDKQKDLYPAFIDTLDKYIGELHAGDQTFRSADILYGGDINKWKKFGNSLKLRIGMRVKYANPALAEKAVTEAMNSPLIANNAESAKVPTQAAGSPVPQINPILAIYRSPQGKSMLGEALVDMLKAKDDPRLTLIAEPTATSKQVYAQTEDIDDLVYRGIPPGITTNEANAIDPSNYSYPSSKIFVNEDVARPMKVLMYSEVAFLQAEAALMGWGATPAQAQKFYQNGIVADLSHFPYNVPQNKIDSYIAREGTLSGTPEQKLGEIMNQQWIAFFDQEKEAFIDWRRTGYPKLDPGDAQGNTGGTIPRRGLYGQNEKIFNHENYEKMLSSQGPDKLTTKIWIDAKQ